MIEAVYYARQAAVDLQQAQQQGRVHLGLQPGSLLLAVDGQRKTLKVDGYGRADTIREASLKGGLTRLVEVLGTADYLAPEQAADPRTADIRADVYSLGCILHFLLTGRPPFQRDSAAETVAAQQSETPKRLDKIRRDVPPELAAVVAKMMAKAPADRYQTPAGVVQALAAFLRPGAQPASPAPTAAPPAAVPAANHRPTHESEASEDGLADVASMLTTSSPTTRKPQKRNAPKANAARGKHRGKKAKMPPLKWIAAGAASVLVLLLGGIVIVFRGHRGEEIAGVKPPAATSVVAKSTEVGGDEQELGSTPPLAKAPFDAKQARAHQEAWAKYLRTTVETTNSVSATMILIPPGEFLMGSSDEQIETATRAALEAEHDHSKETIEFIRGQVQRGVRPQHRVVINNPFLMGATETTIGQFRQFAGETQYRTEAERSQPPGPVPRAPAENWKPPRKQPFWQSPGYPVSNDSPVTLVTWNDACAFCNWLSEKHGLTPWYRPDGDTWFVADRASGYRLPTEAEWEYACRAGTTTLYAFGDDPEELDNFGWFLKNSVSRARAVGLMPPNAFGLLDMHGNADEWCQDFYSETWYETSPLSDPRGPSTGNRRVTRGGNWRGRAYGCTNAYRGSSQPSFRGFEFYGFRYMRVLEGQTAIASAIMTNNRAPAIKPHENATPWKTRPFQQWMNEVAGLPADKQLEAVAKKLQELNPGFDGTITGAAGGASRPVIKNGAPADVVIATDQVTDISPVRALAGVRDLAFINGKLADISPLQEMPLTWLFLRRTQVSDLTPLKGMPLSYLNLFDTKVSDLTPLRQMKLKSLSCSVTSISGLSPLQGMPLEELDCRLTRIVDLSPLTGMPLKRLDCSYTEVADLSPLLDCKGLLSLDVRVTKVTNACVAALKTALPNCQVLWDGSAAASSVPLHEPTPPATGVTTFNSAAFQQWMKDVAALPAAKQVEAVGKKLQELNPGFDGKIRPAPIYGFAADEVIDISPVRALPQLQRLVCNGEKKHSQLSDLSPLRGMALQHASFARTWVSDLSPLIGMPLTVLNLNSTNVSDLSVVRQMKLEFLDCSAIPVSDLSPLRGMPLQRAEFDVTQVSDLSPLAGMPLTFLRIAQTPVSDLSPLRQIKLDYLHCGGTLISDLSPLKGMPLTWLDCSANDLSDLSPLNGMPLAYLRCDGTRVRDLSPLGGMPLVQLSCSSTQVSDLSPLKGMPLTRLSFYETRVTDLSPLKGMPLTTLGCGGTRITDLSPLEGMPLEELDITYVKISDLSSLASCKYLKSLVARGTKVTAGGVATLQKALPDCKIYWDDPTVGQ